MIGTWHITLSANAGIALCTEGFRLWADAVHEEGTKGFSPLTPALQDAFFENAAFANPDLIFFTHCHPDHFSRRLALRAQELCPGATFVLPEEQIEGQITLQGEEMLLQKNGRLLYFRRLTHEGEEYYDVPHYGLIVEDAGEHILITGDAQIAGDDMRAFTEDIEIDTAILPFLWRASKQGTEFIADVIRPKHLILYHLPFPEDDTCGYLPLIRQFENRDDICPDIRLLTFPFQTEELA